MNIFFQTILLALFGILILAKGWVIFENEVSGMKLLSFLSGLLLALWLPCLASLSLFGFVFFDPIELSNFLESASLLYGKNIHWFFAAGVVIMWVSFPVNYIRAKRSGHYIDRNSFLTF